MRCASCGFDMQNPSKFCPGCGKPDRRAVMIAVVSVFIALLGLGVLSLGGI